MKRAAFATYSKILRAVDHIRAPQPFTPVSSPQNFFHDIYFRHISTRIDALKNANHLRIMDAGCGAGALSIRLAKIGHEVVGIDASKHANESARNSARDENLCINFVDAHLSDYLRSVPDNQYDVVLCIDVLPFNVRYRDIFAQLSRVLIQGGLLFVTFQPAYYFITTLLRQGKFDAVKYVNEHDEGLLRIAKVPAYYNWPSNPEIQRLHENNNLKLFDSIPIGRYSGFDRDGIAGVFNLECIDSESSYSLLMEIELDHRHSCVNQCRYVLYGSIKLD